MVTPSGHMDSVAVSSGPPILHDIQRAFRLALPIFGGQMSSALAGLIDAIMIGYLGAGALAAVGFGALVFFVAVSLTVGVESATQTLSARRNGERGNGTTGRVLAEAIVISFITGIPLGLGLAFWAPEIMAHLHGSPDIRSQGASYLAARAIGLPLVMGVAAFRGFHNGISRPKINLWVAATVLVVHVSLNWMLIFGMFGIPPLGAQGAGIAATISVSVAFTIYIFLGCRDKARGISYLAEARERKVIRRELFRLGTPSGVQWALSWIAMLVFLFFAGQIGVYEAEASYLLIQIVSFLTLAANSFGFTSASMVSQSLGADNPKRAYRSGMVCGCLGAGLLGIVGLFLAVLSEPLLEVLSNDANVIRIAVPVLVMCGLVASLDAFGIVMIFSLIGAGSVRRVMAWNLGGMWLICLPLAWVLGLRYSYGMVGLWTALLGARAVVALAMFYYFRGRSWTTKKFELEFFENGYT